MFQHVVSLSWKKESQMFLIKAPYTVAELSRGNKLHLWSQVRGEATAVGKWDVMVTVIGELFISLWAKKDYGPADNASQFDKMIHVS